jgi:hypothetical protein
MRINPEYLGKRVQCPNKECNCRFVPPAPGAPNSVIGRSATAKSTIALPSAPAAAPDQIVTHGLTPPITLRINRPHFLGLKKPEYSYEAYRQTVFPNSAAERFLTGAISVAPRGSNCRVRVRLGDCFETPDEIAARIGQQIQKIHRVYAV